MEIKVDVERLLIRCTIEEARTIRYKPHFGTVYFLQWGDHAVKIGSTRKPRKRFLNLAINARYADVKLGDVFMLSPCTNYRELENAFHKYFRYARKQGTELFDADLIEIVSDVMWLYINDWFKLFDDSSWIEHESRALFNAVMDIVSGRAWKEELPEFITLNIEDFARIIKLAHEGMRSLGIKPQDIFNQQ